MTLQNDRLIKALQRQPVDKTPVWIMRQAGRYLPEYNDVRKKAGDFLTLCKTPELATEATLQPLARFDLDAAILFSDILMLPEAMGMALHFGDGNGPYFTNPANNTDKISSLKIPTPEKDLQFVFKTIEMLRHELDNKVPLIGFAGSPWTVACYMVEGNSSKQFNIIKAMLYQQPQLLHQLLEKITQATILYLQAQIEAGVQVIMLFDTWGGILTTEAYQHFSLDYMTKIINALPKHHNNSPIPSILFTKGGHQWLEYIVNSGCDAIGLDWTIGIDRAQALVGNHVALQGNMDPAVLYAKPERIRQEVASILARFGPEPGHIFNLGHGIYPDIPAENVKVFVDAVHELSIQYHAGKPYEYGY